MGGKPVGAFCVLRCANLTDDLLYRAKAAVDL